MTNLRRLFYLVILTPILACPGCGKSDQDAAPAAPGQSQPAPQQNAGPPPEDPKYDLALVREHLQETENQDAVGRAMEEIKALEDRAAFAEAKRRAEALLPTISADDSRNIELSELMDRLDAEAARFRELTTAVENLKSDDSETRRLAEEKIAAAGRAGQIMVRKQIRETDKPKVLMAAAGLIRKSKDYKAAPLLVQELKENPGQHLWNQLLNALSAIIREHSRDQLSPDLLMELLVLAETRNFLLETRMLRGIAAGWEFDRLDPELLQKLYAQFETDKNFNKRHLACFLAIAMQNGAKGDVQTFNELLGGDGRVAALRDYVREARQSEDKAVTSWAELVAPMLGMVNLNALKKGLFLYLDFNEPLYNPKYSGKRPMIWLRDQSGPEVTNLSARTTLKGVLTDGCRVPAIDGRGILFKPTGMIQFPQGREYMKVTSDSYSYAAWIRPLSLPDDSRQRYYWVIIGKHERREGLKLYPDGVIYFTHQTSDKHRHSLRSRTTLAANEWHHVAGVVDRAQGIIQLFVDGALEAQSDFPAGTAGSPLLDSSFGVIGGAAQVGERTHTFDGVIDEVRIYQKALTSDEVQDLYRAFAANIPKANAVPLQSTIPPEAAEAPLE